MYCSAGQRAVELGDYRKFLTRQHFIPLTYSALLVKIPNEKEAACASICLEFIRLKLLGG